MSRTHRQREWLDSMPKCSEGNCTRKVTNVKTQLCATHYQQTPYGRDLALRQKYGIQIGEYDRLMEMQQGRCGICLAEESVGRDGKVTRLCVDHCHKTGGVRGLLCSRCNAAIGLLQDDPKLIHKAAIWANMLEEEPWQNQQIIFYEGASK